MMIKTRKSPSTIVVPYGKKELVFSYPKVRSIDGYSGVKSKILSSNQNVPVGDSTASLLHAAYCNPEFKEKPEFRDIREIVRTNWLWVFDRNLWTQEGVYILQDQESIEISNPLDQNELEQMLKTGKDFKGIRFSQDGKLRFAPEGSYHLGEHTPESLAKDGLVIANYGFEGAEKLAEVASLIGGKPRINGVEKRYIRIDGTSEQKLSVLVDSGLRLGVAGLEYGDDWYGDRQGYAFGVLK